MCLIILFTSRLVTTYDENYTLKIIQFSYYRLLKLNTIDVHPPLYYLILKLYLSIFTFWTQSIIIKILFARILSVIFSLGTFFFLIRSLYYLDIKINYMFSLMLFLILPNVTGINAMSNEQLVDIRMYSFSGFILSVIIYFSINYIRYNKKYYIYIIGSLSIIAAYTNYYLALTVGLMILITSIKYLIEVNIKKSLQFLYIDLLMALSYIPWIPILLNQLKASKSVFNYTNGDLSKQIIVFLIIFLLFLPSYINYFYSSNFILNNQIIIIICTLILSFIIPVTMSIIGKPMFRFRYLYPILLVYEFMSLNILIKINDNKWSRIYYFGIMFLLILSMSVSIYQQFKIYSIQSIQICQNINKWSNSKKKIIKLNPRNDKINGGTQTNLNTQYAFYLASINKYVKCKGLYIPSNKDYLPLYRQTIDHICK